MPVLAIKNTFPKTNLIRTISSEQDTPRPLPEDVSEQDLRTVMCTLHVHGVHEQRPRYLALALSIRAHQFVEPGIFPTLKPDLYRTPGMST